MVVYSSCWHLQLAFCLESASLSPRLLPVAGALRTLWVQVPSAGYPVPATTPVSFFIHSCLSLPVLSYSHVPKLLYSPSAAPSTPHGPTLALCVSPLHCRLMGRDHISASAPVPGPAPGSERQLLSELAEGKGEGRTEQIPPGNSNPEPSAQP